MKKTAKEKKTVNASLTIDVDLLDRVKKKMKSEDITFSQYIRRLARRDLGLDDNMKQAA